MLKDRMTSVAPEGTVQIKARKCHGAHPPPSSNGDVVRSTVCVCVRAESSLELPPGSGIHWEFQLASKDIGFSVKFERVKEDGSAEEVLGASAPSSDRQIAHVSMPARPAPSPLSLLFSCPAL